MVVRLQKKYFSCFFQRKIIVVTRCRYFFLSIYLNNKTNRALAKYFRDFKESDSLF